MDFGISCNDRKAFADPAFVLIFLQMLVRLLQDAILSWQIVDFLGTQHLTLHWEITRIKVLRLNLSCKPRRTAFRKCGSENESLHDSRMD